MSAPPLPEPRIEARLPREPPGESLWTRADIQVNPVLQDVYFHGAMEDAAGASVRLRDSTNPLQGRHLYNLVRDNGLRRTLEVGLAMGTSAAWITQALRDGGARDAEHIAVDPNQRSQYGDLGLLLVDRCGNGDLLRHLAQPSHLALPELLAATLRGERPRLDLVFVDGWHTFDFALLDVFYADRLLAVNGLLVLDDIRHRGVRQLFEYLCAT